MTSLATSMTVQDAMTTELVVTLAQVGWWSVVVALPGALPCQERCPASPPTKSLKGPSH